MKALLFILLALANSAFAQPAGLKFNSPAPPRSFLHARPFTPLPTPVSEASTAITGGRVGAPGGAGVSRPPAAVSRALSRGIADMALMPLTGVATFKVHEVATSSLDVAMGADSAMVFISKKRWDSLPPQAK